MRPVPDVDVEAASRFARYAASRPSEHDRLKDYWTRWFKQENPPMSKTDEPIVMMGDLPYPERPDNTVSPLPWAGVRGTPNAPCCKESCPEDGLEADVAGELARILSLFRERQAKYGPKNIAEFGEVGVLVRLYDKLARLRNYYMDGGIGDMADESVADAWQDISCYAAIALVCRRGAWPGAVPFHASKDAL